jgi:hypothetical protein
MTGPPDVWIYLAENLSMKRKDPSELVRNYPASRAKPGQKAKARTVARAAGEKTFRWHCPTHGAALFSTAGSGACRQCLAEAQRAAKRRAASPAPLDPETQTRQDYLAAMASKNNHPLRDQKPCTSSLRSSC